MGIHAGQVCMNEYVADIRDVSSWAAGIGGSVAAWMVRHPYWSAIITLTIGKATVRYVW